MNCPTCQKPLTISDNGYLKCSVSTVDNYYHYMEKNNPNYDHTHFQRAIDGYCIWTEEDIACLAIFNGKYKEITNIIKPTKEFFNLPNDQLLTIINKICLLC